MARIRTVTAKEASDVKRFERGQAISIPIGDFFPGMEVQTSLRPGVTLTVVKVDQDAGEIVVSARSKRKRRG